jgi:hypothetical protein
MKWKGKEHYQTHEASTTLTPKLDKDITKEIKLQSNFLDEHRHKKS